VAAWRQDHVRRRIEAHHALAVCRRSSGSSGSSGGGSSGSGGGRVAGCGTQGCGLRCWQLECLGLRLRLQRLTQGRRFADRGSSPHKISPNILLHHNQLMKLRI